MAFSQCFGASRCEQVRAGASRCEQVRAGFRLRVLMMGVRHTGWWLRDFGAHWLVNAIGIARAPCSKVRSSARVELSRSILLQSKCMSTAHIPPPYPYNHVDSVVVPVHILTPYMCFS